MAGILGAIPFGTPYILAPGVVGVGGYISEDLKAGVSSGGTPPWSLTIDEVPLTYFVSAGSLPPGLGFNFPSPLSAVIVPPDADGVNVIRIIGNPVPTMAGIFNFSITWRTALYPQFGNQAVRQYRIVITEPPIIPKKKNRGLFAPQTICCDPKSFADKVCPPQVKFRGYYYDKVSENCYVLRRR